MPSFKRTPRQNLGYRNEGVNPKEKAQLEVSISTTDEANQRELERLLSQCGWPGGLDKKTRRILRLLDNSARTIGLSAKAF